jgi:DNA-directed RNA polymerase alpha subunit
MKADKALKKLLNTSVTKLNLKRMRTSILVVFTRMNIKTIEDLLSHNPATLLKQRNFGKLSLNSILDALNELGLTLPR